MVGVGTQLTMLPSVQPESGGIEQSLSTHYCSCSFPTGGRSTASPPGKSFLSIQSVSIRSLPEAGPLTQHGDRVREGGRSHSDPKSPWFRWGSTGSLQSDRGGTCPPSQRARLIMRGWSHLARKGARSFCGLRYPLSAR